MRTKWISILGVLLGFLLIAGNASAISDAEHHWADVIEFGFGSDGLVTANDPLVYSHVFDDPRLDLGQVAAIDKVQLSVLLSDSCENWVGCRYDLRNHDEWAVIVVEGDQIYSGELSEEFLGVGVELVVRDITLIANVTARGDEIDISIASMNGEDFRTLLSVAEYYYDDASPGAVGGPGGSTPMPEPSAAVIFGVGLLVLSRRIRR